MDLKGKKVAFLGDSITEGVGTSAPDKRYSEILGRKYGFTPVNFGVSGTHIAKQIITEKSVDWDYRDFCTRCVDIKGFDVVVIFGGTNDFGHGSAQLGEKDSTDYTTFYGGLNYIYTTLKKNNPNATFIVLTPIKRIPDYCPEERKVDIPFIDFINAIRFKAKEYGFNLLDSYEEFQIDVSSKEDLDKLLPDGLHPSDKGNEQLAEIISKFIDKL